VMHAYKKISSKIKDDASFSEEINLLKNKIYSA